MKRVILRPTSSRRKAARQARKVARYYGRMFDITGRVAARELDVKPTTVREDVYEVMAEAADVSKQVRKELHGGRKAVLR